MKRIVLPLLLIGALAGSAQAAPVLHFDNDLGDGGTLSYQGGASALVGTNIGFSSIVGEDTALNNGALLKIANGRLDFVTGAFLTQSLGTYYWVGGGSFTIAGTAYVDANNNDTFDLGEVSVATGNLLTGTFANNAFGYAANAQPGIQNWTIGGVGIDQKNAGLLAFYGITGNDFVFANTEISAQITPDGEGRFSGTVLEADVTNTSVSGVPEPGTLSIAALGVAAMLRRRRR